MQNLSNVKACGTRVKIVWKTVVKVEMCSKKIAEESILELKGILVGIYLGIQFRKILISCYRHYDFTVLQ